MAALVGNLIRRLEKFVSHKPDPTVAGHLDEIQKAFHGLQPFLNDAELKRDKYEEISMWVSRVAALATEVEDIVVSYNLHLFKMNRGSLYSNLLYRQISYRRNDSVTAKIRRFLSRRPLFIISDRNLSLKDELPLLQNPTGIRRRSSINVQQMRFIGTGLLELFKWFSKAVTMEIAKFYSEASSVRRLVRNTVAQAPDTNVLTKPDSRKAIRAFLGSGEVVGRKMEFRKVEDWLLTEASGPVVMGVTGDAGIGKSTFTAALYDGMRRQFDCHAWVIVAPNATTSLLRDMLKGILRSTSVMAPSNMDAINEAHLREVICHQLTGKKFLLVLDDIQTPESLGYVKDAIPQDCKAKIICTTQKISLDCNQVLNLPRLSSQNAFNLLQKRAFLGRDGTRFWSSRPVQAEADAILKVCNGLPLAIATVAGMLSTKRMETKEWNKVNDMLKEVHFIPSSYADLSPVLKSCFLYAASFPSHLEISSKRLQRLWIAEGFVEDDAQMTLEEAAKLQLDELIQRNMIQVAQVGTDGGIESCQILSSMRDFAIKRCRKDQFCTILKSEGNTTLPERSQRLLLPTGSSGRADEFDNVNTSQLYSLLAFKGNKDQPLFFTSISFKVLSVLELQKIFGDTLPDAIGDLSLLRYLALRGTTLKKLPSSLKKLHSLQTLDIRDTIVRELPAGLEELKMLRHLLLKGSFSNNVVNLSVKIEVLQNLRTVAGLHLTEGIAKGLNDLPQIQKLSLGDVDSNHVGNLFKSIKQMNFLRSFTMKSAQKEKIDMASFNPHGNLEKLRIGGHVENLLDRASKLHALKYLYLWDNFLIQDPFSALQHLPNLLLLSLCSAYDGEEIQFGAGGFLRLKRLSIIHCSKLVRWSEIEGRAMGKLEMLTIAYCPKLSGLPKGMEELTSLQALQVSNMPAHIIKEARSIHSNCVSKFSFHVQDAKPSSAAYNSPGTKKFPMPMQAQLIRKNEPPNKYF